MRPQDPVKLRRIGLVLEMEDGSKVMVYADDLVDAQATITTETPEPHDFWGRPDWFPRLPRAPRTSILIEGIGAHKLVFTEPGVKVSVPGRELEQMRRAVQ
jgi:hypothetical protein